MQFRLQFIISVQLSFEPIITIELNRLIESLYLDDSYAVILFDAELAMVRAISAFIRPQVVAI